MLYLPVHVHIYQYNANSQFSCFIRRLLSSHQTGGSTALHIEREQVAHMSLVWRRLMSPCICAEAAPADMDTQWRISGKLFSTLWGRNKPGSRNNSKTMRACKLSPSLCLLFHLCCHPVFEPAVSLTKQLCVLR